MLLTKTCLTQQTNNHIQGVKAAIVIAHFVQLVKIETLYGGFVDPLLEEASDLGRIHASIGFETATGR